MLQVRRQHGQRPSSLDNNLPTGDLQETKLKPGTVTPSSGAGAATGTQSPCACPDLAQPAASHTWNMTISRL